MHRKISILPIVLALFTFAAAAVAQNADPNTAAPTKNDLRLRVTEPVEGARIVGSSVRVTIDYNRQIFGAGQGTKFGEANFPHTIFDVFMDNKLQKSLKTGEDNVANIDNVPLGDHKIVVVAKNISGEVIDRQQIGITTVADTVVSSVPNAPAPAPAAAAYSAPAPPPPSTSMNTYDTTPAAPATLPQTGSQAPRMAFAGLLLAVSGLFVVRKKR